MNKFNNRTHCKACTKHCIDSKQIYCTEFDLYITKEAMYCDCSSFDSKFKKNKSKNT
jgi:hypothetical protein